TQSALSVVRLRHEGVALRDERGIDRETRTSHPAPLVAGVADAAGTGGARSGLQRVGGAVVAGVDLVQGAHDLGRAPRLIDAQVGDEVGGLHAAVGAVAPAQRAATASGGAGDAGITGHSRRAGASTR